MELSLSFHLNQIHHVPMLSYVATVTRSAKEAAIVLVATDRCLKETGHAADAEDQSLSSHLSRAMTVT